MLFNSFEFLVFYPVVTILFFLLPHRFRWFHLLVASCIFYMAFVPVYILILGFTIVIDYIAGILIEDAKGPKRKWWLIISLISNIGILAVFKYYNFFIDNINAAAGTQFSFLRILLPIGLSFHTFQAMSYTIEVYRGHQKAERHFGIYALYVMFYPQLVAGPIERPQNVLHQFHEKKHFSAANLYSGLRLMAWGLFKKVVIADRISTYVDIVYAEPNAFHYLNIIIATILFAIQIYCDFSGYSDMAIGIARTMGYELMVNFNRPYFSTNIRTFWSRWHMSLSTWFRDYLYIPLGGNRVSLFRVYFNTAVVFVVSGFWHGANWTFIVWGALHALYIVVYIFYDKNLKHKVASNEAPSWPLRWTGNLLGFAFTFSLVCLAWVFFRASSVNAAWEVITNMTRADNHHSFEWVLMGKKVPAQFGGMSSALSIIMIALMLGVEWKTSPRLAELDRRPLIDIAFFSITTALIILVGVFSKASFIYFQF